MYVCFFFFFKQKTAYEMRISDWSSDVCSSDLRRQSACAQCGLAGGREAGIGDWGFGIRREAGAPRRQARGRRHTFALPNPQSPIPNPCCSGAAAMTRFVVIVLVIANVVTAIGVVSARHEHRQLDRKSTRLNSSH